MYNKNYDVLEKKYHSFFQEFRDFVIMMKWARNENLIGLTREEIISFEQENNITLGLGLRGYWSLFGKRLDIPFMSDYSYCYTLDKAISTKELIEQYRDDYPDVIFEEAIARELNKSDVFKEKLKDKVIILNEIIENDILYFTMEKQQDFLVYSCSFTWEEDSIFKISPTCLSIIEKLRAGIINGLIKIKNNTKESTDVQKIPWLSYYAKVIGENINIRQERKAYFKFINEEDIGKKYFRGIDEYEIGFIRFLIEEKGYPLEKDIFDPYAPVVTFYEYLRDD